MIEPAALREQKALQELLDAKKRKSKVSFTPEEIVLITDYSATHTKIFFILIPILAYSNKNLHHPWYI